MKCLVALAPVCALLCLTACTQSPEKLVSTANKYHAKKRYKEASILYQKAITKDKTYAEAYYRQGLNLIDDGSPAEAAKFLRRAVDLKPSNLDASSKLAEILLAAYAQNPQRNKSLLTDIRDLDKKILQQNPNSFDGIRIQGLLYLADKNLENGLASFARANQIKPHARELVGWYAQTLMASHQEDQAFALIRDMLAHDKTWGPGYDFLFLQYTQANDRGKAEAVLREHVANDPKSSVAVINLANFLLMSNRYGEAEAAIRRVLDDKESFPNGHQLLGDFYARAKKYDQSIQQYQAGVKADSKNALGYQERMVAVYELAGKRDQALQLAKDLAAKNSKDASANELYASMLLQTGNKADLSKSMVELKKLVDKNPNSPSLHLDLAKGHFALGDMNNSLSEANEAVRLNPRLLPARLVAARIYEDRGQHTKAIEQVNPVLDAQPQNADARLIRARALIGLNQIDKAQPELEALVQQVPQMNEARLQLANLYLAEQNYQKASDQFEQLWKANPPDVRGYVGLQTIKLAQGKHDEAIQAMEDLVQKNPATLPLRYQLAGFQTAGGAQEAKTDPARAAKLYQQAADNYKQILKTSVNSADVWLRLGALQRELKQTDAALASYEQAAQADPRSAEAFLNKGMVLEEMGKKKEAADAYNRTLGIDPHNTLALNNLAYLNAESKTNLDQAMTFAERAKSQVPNSPDISDTLGFVYYQKNLNAEALRIFKQIVQDYPKNATFHFHLAMALLKEGDKQGARDEAEKALKITSQPSEQEKIRSFVSQIG
ncbi:MAG TPA: tetratricopeptide repeat protein [Bryobacteraceae bacterium]|jgi:tetratricopeptide (TPR) repeat protein